MTGLRCVVLCCVMSCSALPLPAQDAQPTAVVSDTSRGLAGKKDSSSLPRVFFRDMAAEVGVTTVPHTTTDRRYVLETAAGGGVASDTRLHFELGREAMIQGIYGLWEGKPGLQKEK